MPISIHKIKKVNFTGKWMEFWFYGNEDESFHKCCKQYMFWELVDKKEGMQDDINNNGIKDMYIVWEKDQYNSYDPIDVSRDPKYILETYVTCRVTGEMPKEENEGN